jgi:hypothetical protein
MVMFFCSGASAAPPANTGAARQRTTIAATSILVSFIFSSLEISSRNV